MPLDLDAFRRSLLDEQALPPTDQLPPAFDVDAFRESLGGRRGAPDINFSLEESLDTNPDARAKAEVIGEEEALPADVVEAEQPEFERRKRLRDMREALLSSPMANEWFSDPDNAKIAHDDIENLTTIESLVNQASDISGKLSTAFERGQLLTRRGRLGMELRRTRAPEVEEALKRNKDRMTLLGEAGDSGVLSFFEEAGEVVGLMYESMFTTEAAARVAAGGGIGATLGAFGGPLAPVTAPAGALAGMGAGFLSHMVSDMFAIEGGLSYIEQLEAGVDPDVAKWTALGVGFLNAGLEVAGATVVLRPISIAAKRMLKIGIKQAMKRATVIGAAKTFGLTYGASVGAEVSTEIMQEGVNIAAEEIGKSFSEGEFEGITQEEVTERITLIAEKTFKAMVVLGFPGSGANFAMDVRAARRAKRNQQVFEAMGESAQASKVRQRLPAKYREFVERVKARGNVESVYVDVDAIMTLMQSEVLDPEVIEGLPDLIAEAREVGQAVAIPLEDYQTHIAGTDVGQALIGDIKFAADDFTANEADRFNAEVAEIFEAEFNAALEAKKLDREAQGPFDRIFDNIQAQLIAAGQTPSNAAQQAALHSAHARVLQDRYGVDPETVYGQLAIKGPLPESLVSPIEDIDLIIERARRGVDASDAKLFGESLQEMARRMGIRDDRGDLLSQDIDKGLKPFQRKMLRPGGRQIDDVLEAAVEAGFFPETGGERREVSLAEFIEALTGPDLFIIENADTAEAARVQATNDLIETLHRLGVDLDAPNAEIKAALDAAETVEGGRTLGQPDDAGSFRGNIQFFPDRAIINLGKSADLSTFLHESGHLFVNTLAALAETNEVAAADLGAMMSFAGVETVEGFNAVEAQEKLARAFEAYLREGKAPSPELQTAFARFRSWLINIYRTLRNLDVEIDDSIRGVFDRMLATDDEIAEAERINNFIPEPGVAELMNDKERAAYVKAAQVATDQAAFQLEKQKIAELSREETARWKEEFEAVRAEIAEGVDAQPVYRAIDAIRGRATGLYLSRDAVEGMVGKEGARKLPGGLTRVSGGVHPDFVAEQHGFTSGDEMLFAMMNAAKNKTERAALVKDQAEARMKERHGSLNDNTAQAAEAASEIVHNDERGAFLAMELRALARESEGQATPASVAKAAAKRIMAAKKTKDAIQVGKYAAAEVRAAKAATRALLKGDIPAAAEAKRQQLLNHYLFMEARKAREELDAMVRYFSKFNKRIKALDPEYAEQIEGLLERYDFRRAVSLKEIERRKSLAAFVAAQNEDNQPVSIDEALLTDARRQHYKDTSLEELRGLKDAVKHLEHLGRLKNRLLSDQARRELNDTVQGMVDSIRENWRGKTRTRTLSRTPLERASEWWQSKASLRRIEFLFRELDGFKPGPMQETLFGIIATADDNLQERRSKAAGSIRELFHPFKWREVKSFFRKKAYIPEINDSLTHESILAAALNTGNIDNREKLLKGSNWTEEGLDAVLAKMTKRDWDLVQGIWDYIDTFWPETVELDKETKGFAAPKVEADAVETPFGTYRGGYYPLKYSTRDSERAHRNSTEDIYKRMIMGDLGRPTTNQGRTKERLAPTQGMSVRLDLGVFFEAIDETMHDLAFRKAAVDASKILNHPDLVEALKDTVGEPRIDLLRDWLKDSVAGDVTPVSNPADKAFAHVRKRTTIMAMGYKLSTALIQPLGYTQTMARFIQDAGVGAGLKYSIKGIREFYGAPVAKTRFVQERSAFMRQRAQTWDRDVHDAVKSLKKGPLSYYEDSFFWHIAKMQLAVDYPTWLGAYKWSLDAQPEKGETAAIQYADSVVRMTQGAGAAKDLAPIQKGGQGTRIFNMFMTYFSAMNNMILDEARMLKRNPTPRQVAQFSTNMFLLTVVPAVLVEVAYTAAGVTGPDDDESWGEYLFKSWVLQTAGGLPVIRDILSATVGDFPFALSPVAASVKRAVGLAEQIGQGEFDRAAFSSALTAAALVAPVPIPSGQIMIMGDYFADKFAGEKDGFNPVEAFVRRNYRK